MSLMSLYLCQTHVLLGHTCQVHAPLVSAVNLTRVYPLIIQKPSVPLYLTQQGQIYQAIKSPQSTNLS